MALPEPNFRRRLLNFLTMKTFTNTTGTRAILTILFFAIFSNTTFTQSIWNADAVGGTVNWNTPGNWIGGVPNASKTVTIFTCATCPRISSQGTQSKFVQVYPGGKLTIGAGGSLSIENPGGPGLKTHATSQVKVNQGGSLVVKNFWGEGIATGGVFQNDGSISINGGHTGIAVSAGASFTNNGNTSVTGYSLNYAMTSSGAVLNNGTMTLDDANNDGISLHTGTFTNAAPATLNITKTGVNAVFAKGTFFNAGDLNIDNGLNGIYVVSGTFTNNANGKLNISGSAFLNTGVYATASNFKNEGELNIQHALSKGIEISGGSSFSNFNKINLNVPAWAGIFNVGGSNFTNNSCALIESTAAVVNYANFTNSGIVKAPGSGGTSISVNEGSLIGAFPAVSGNAPITETGVIVWTGCASTDWNEPANWYPTALPSQQFSKAYVQNVAHASGNAPIVSTTSGSTNLVLDKNAAMTIASGGSLTVSSGYLGYGSAKIRQSATLTIQPSGRLTANWIGVNGNVQNAGEVSIPAPFHSVGSFSMAGGNFTNLPGSNFTASVGQYGAGVNASLSNGATFSNSGVVSIGGFGGFSLNNSSLTNTAPGSIGIGIGILGWINLENNSTAGNAGSIGIYGKISTVNSTFTNSGNITISMGDPGIYVENATFANSGSMNLGSCHVQLRSGSFHNSGSVDIVAPQNDGVINDGNFVNTGTLSVTASGTHHGVLNLFAGKFHNEASGQLFFSQTSNGFINFGHLGNAGLIDINTTNYARGIESQGTAVNQSSGRILIKNPKSDGLVTFYKLFENYGYIEVLDAAGWGVAASGPFENKASGHIYVNTAGKAGVASWDSFKNAGLIESENLGSEGVAVANGEFNNLPGSQIFIRNTAGAGLINFETFLNHGYLSIDNPGAEGIRNLNFKFDNRPGGSSTVVISNALSGPGIYTSNGFFNSGSVILENTPLAVLIEPSGYFNNHPCAEVKVDGQIENRNVLNNEGLLTTTFQGTNTGSGTLKNKGIVEDVFGSFNGLPLSNAAVRARPISGTIGGFIQNALEIGPGNPFQISSTWYTGPDLTAPAGTYLPGVNTFQPTVGVGTHLLFFTAKDLVNGCTRTVSVQVSISSMLAGKELNDQAIPKIFIFPNPFKAHTTINLSLPFDSKCKLIVFDDFGRQVDVIYEGEMRKDELYQFEFDGSDSRVSNYTATLILKSGRAWSVRLVKADN